MFAWFFKLMRNDVKSKQPAQAEWSLKAHLPIKVPSSELTWWQLFSIPGQNIH